MDGVVDDRARPVVLLLFANDDRQPLAGLDRESWEIREVLDVPPLNHLLRVQHQSPVTAERFGTLLSRELEHVVGVHFGGHSGAEGLHFESETGEPLLLGMRGFARMLGRLPNLRWVFLNACATDEHVLLLGDAIEAPIVATARAVRDDVAVRFARLFYAHLAAGASIADAYELARGEREAASGDDPMKVVRTAPPPGSWFRLLRPARYPRVDGEPEPAYWPWLLRLHEARPRGGEWRLTDTLGSQPGGAGVQDVDSEQNLSTSLVARRLVEHRDAYLAPIRSESINHQSIPRSQAREVARLLEERETRVVVVAGGPGSGKTGVIAQVVEHFDEVGWPTLVFRMDRLEPCGTKQALGEHLELSSSPTEALLRYARGGPCLIVIDQLDAVSTTSGRNTSFLDRMAEFIDDARRTTELRLVLGCRTFDLEGDYRIRSILGPGGDARRVDVGPLAEEVVKQALADAGRDAGRDADALDPSPAQVAQRTALPSTVDRCRRPGRWAPDPNAA